MIATWAGTLVEWEEELARLKERVGSVLSRAELRRSSGAFIDGLLSGAERKTGWLMAEEAGLDRPYRIQSLLGRSRWSADDLRDTVRGYVFETLGCPDGVLVVDETGFVKKGDQSVGVARQYSGTAGRIENAQVGVFLAYASRFGQALIDRRLYLPEAWAKDGARRAKTQVPEAVGFATKIEMAREMIASALDAMSAAGYVPPRWVLADALYGGDHRLRHLLEERRQPYVLAVRSNHHLRFFSPEGLMATDPATIAADLPLGAWATLAAGEGTKGLRLYDWARLKLPWAAEDGFERWLLIRRHRREPDKLAFYLAFAPQQTIFAELAAAAGMRWTIEECFERAKGELGLDHCEARSWHGWHRHMTLVMAAAAFLAKLAADLRRSAFGKANERSPTNASALC
ncbi:IS701 family transposase [Telmatospirillum sp.]|uniref:IS701 family transposase n=1 Tax=Telmatospirillum sp. TaxID=2079197 RepID=UPI00284C6F67|nr:IS701 family transposase [Telmatospirillum sp.]MDR3438630.1 IS701 family transposase [Telmatospirillum sp.]